MDIVILIELAKPLKSQTQQKLIGKHWLSSIYSVCRLVWNLLTMRDTFMIDYKETFSFIDVIKSEVSFVFDMLFEPCSEKTSLRGFRPGPTQTGLYSHRRWLDA